MSHPYVLIAVIMLAAGLAGGYFNYLVGKHDEGGPGRAESSLGGVIASFAIPLFLNMTSSNLLDSIGSSPSNPRNYFLLAGFCLVAAVSSKAFISNLSARVLSEARTATKAVSRIQEQVAPIIAKETEETEDGAPSLVFSPPASTASEEAQKLLSALGDGRYTYRSTGGLSRQTGIGKDKLDGLLGNLASDGLVGKTQLAIRGEPRPFWHLSDKGRAITK
jgi:hypothetical protein